MQDFLLPPPWRSPVSLAGSVPATGLALSLQRHSYHVIAWALVNGKGAAKEQGNYGTGARSRLQLLRLPQSPHPVWRQPQQFNLLHTLEIMWPQVIGPTLGCSTSSLGGGELPESLLLTGDRQPGPVRRYSTWRANSLQLGGSRYRMTYPPTPRSRPAYILQRG